MKKKSFIAKKVLMFLTLLLLTLACCGVSVSASSLKHPDNAKPGTFVQKDGRWFYQYSDKTYAKDVFLNIDNKTYYFSKNGYRWCYWHTINGKRYYFGHRNQGYLFKDALIIYRGERYYLNKNGTMKTGWHTTKTGNRFYFGPDGKAYTGEHMIDGYSYCFSSRGILQRVGPNYGIGSDCALLIDADTGRVIYGKRQNVPHANASTTKILTCILALENCDPNEKVTFSPYAASMEPTKLWASAGETFYMRDLLYSLMLPSHNDTAVAIAEHISGSVENFTALMNQKAASIGCRNTHFETPNGLDYGYNHYTTATDLAKIARYAIKNSTFRQIIGTSSYAFSNLSGERYYVSTTNALLNSLSGVQGMKTGYTNKAGYCFVGLRTVPTGQTYISVILGAHTSSQRWSDSRYLLEDAYRQ